MKSVLPFRGDDTLMYSITYDLVTPESASEGGYAENGYVVEPTEGELQDILLEANRDYGIYKPVGVGVFVNTQAPEDKDYFEKGHEKYYTLTITKSDGSKLNQEELDFITALLNEGKYYFDEESNRFYEWGGTPEYGIGGWIGGTLIGGFLGYQVGKAVGYGRAVRGYEGGGEIIDTFTSIQGSRVMPNNPFTIEKENKFYVIKNSKGEVLAKDTTKDGIMNDKGMFLNLYEQGGSTYNDGGEISRYSDFKNKVVVKFIEKENGNYVTEVLHYPSGELKDKSKPTKVKSVASRIYIKKLGENTDGVLAEGSFTEWVKENKFDEKQLKMLKDIANQYNVKMPTISSTYNDGGDIPSDYFDFQTVQYNNGGSIEDITTEFFKRRFDRKPESDPSYYETWKNRIASAVYFDDYSDNMDDESISTLKEIIAEQPNNKKLGLGGLLLAGGFGAYVGYKVGRARPQKKGFDTEKKVANKIKGAVKDVSSKNKPAKAYKGGGEVDGDDIAEYLTTEKYGTDWWDGENYKNEDVEAYYVNIVDYAEGNKDNPYIDEDTAEMVDEIIKEESVNISDIEYEGGGRISDLKNDFKEYKDIEITIKLIPNDGSEEDTDENDLPLNYVGEIYTGGLESDEPYIELGFQVPKSYEGGGEIKSIGSNKFKYKDYEFEVDDGMLNMTKPDYYDGDEFEGDTPKWEDITPIIADYYDFANRDLEEMPIEEWEIEEITKNFSEKEQIEIFDLSLTDYKKEYAGGGDIPSKEVYEWVEVFKRNNKEDYDQQNFEIEQEKKAELEKAEDDEEREDIEKEYEEQKIDLNNSRDLPNSLFDDEIKDSLKEDGYSETQIQKAYDEYFDKYYDENYMFINNKYEDGGYVVRVFEGRDAKDYWKGNDENEAYDQFLNARAENIKQNDVVLYQDEDELDVYDAMEDLEQDDEYAGGGEVDEFDYLYLRPTKNGLILELTDKGIEAYKDEEIYEMYDLFEDVNSNSEWSYIDNAGDVGLGLTEAPVITDGYYFDDNGEFTDEGVKGSRLYVWNDYMIKDLFDTLMEQGQVTLIEVKDKYYGGGMPERGRETITRPAPTTTPTETPSKPDKDNPYLPKVKPKPKASKLILTK